MPCISRCHHESSSFTCEVRDGWITNNQCVHILLKFAFEQVSLSTLTTNNQKWFKILQAALLTTFRRFFFFFAYFFLPLKSFSAQEYIYAGSLKLGHSEYLWEIIICTSVNSNVKTEFINTGNATFFIFLQVFMATLHQPAKWNSDDKLIYANNFNIWSKTNKRKQSNECSPYFACNQTCMLQRRSFRSDILSFNPNAFPSCCVIHCCLLSRWLLISTLVLHPYLPDLSLMLRRRTVKWGNEGDGHLFLTPKFCQLSRWREWLMLWKKQQHNNND